MLKNMKIRSRMLVSYLIIVAFLLITGIISIVMINRVADSLQSFYDMQFQSVTNAMDIRRKCFVVRTNMLNAMLTEDLSETNENINTAKSELQDMYTLLNSLETTYLGEHSQLTEVKADLDSATGTLDQVGDLCLRNLRDDAYQTTRNVFRPYMEDIGDVMKSVGDTAKANALTKVEDADQLSTIAVIVVILFIAASVVASILLAIIMSNSVTKPVNEMNRAAQELAKGNMNLEVNYESKDELGEMADDIRLMTGNVRRVIQDVNYCLSELASGNYTVSSRDTDAYQGDYRQIRNSLRSLRDTMHETLVQINQAADQVNAGGDQVSNSAQALAQGATEQASAVQELAATINEVSGQLSNTADHAKTAKDENNQAHQEIQVCSEHMDQLMHAMENIEAKSQEISKVIKSIEDIAFQTNILALNAAVEAARAGAAGKGFAVVADEVRNLASKSGEASKSTATLIEATIAAVNEGTGLSQATSDSLQAVVESSKKVLAAVNQISNATEEQSNSMAQITVAVDQISSVVQTNSATSEESAAASEELSSQANVLKELISRFRLMDGGRVMHQERASQSYSESDDDAFSSGYAGGGFGSKY